MKRIAFIKIGLLSLVWASLLSCDPKQEKQLTEVAVDTVSLSQAKAYLNQSGFYTRPDGNNREYDLGALKEETPGYMLGLVQAYEGQGDRAISFYLKMAGASLSDSLARIQFIRQWTNSDLKFANEVILAVQFVGRKADGSDLDLAVQNILSQLSADQTRALLMQQGIIVPQQNSPGEYLILENKAQLWPVVYTQQCAKNIKEESMSASDEKWVEWVEKIVAQRMK
ncbi:hypothetical protein [Reichenbachiella ulvae]|uniref:Uncharacterized protein n=1 Tax=Reichenbachiella ulvae TaxID=2980104 RepID=A0ABT3CP22_9BACT|nr:hypothetical protein [Reichenbachiella ulvae]MCV9385496.1 hypothetical protein [Reichenbachiella ulvae]